MKRFDDPMMIIQHINPDEILRTSECWNEYLACIKCYETAAICPNGYGIEHCSGLECPRLQQIIDCEYFG